MPTKTRSTVSATTTTLEKPPYYLANGKKNPEYRQWYKENNPDKYRNKEKKQQELRKKREYQKGRCEEAQCKCAECGIVYNRAKALLEGFRYLRGNRYMGICHSCD